MTAAQRHSWSDPTRYEHKSERQCVNCALIKVSHHQGDSHWIEFWRVDADGIPEKVATDRTPPCEARA